MPAGWVVEVLARLENDKLVDGKRDGAFRGQLAVGANS